MRPYKLKSDEKWKRFIDFLDFFSISDIIFNNIQIVLRISFLLLQEALFHIILFLKL